MPRYFFHIYDDLVLVDDEGLELADDEAARSQALAGARGMMCDQLRAGHLTLHHRVEVEGEAGESLLILTFGDAVRILP
ncbi:MAG: DUF6894 family protein [Allosphingosinicella sp.]